MRRISLVLCLFALLPMASARSSVPKTPLRLARIFGDGVVLQRATPVPVWGTSEPGAGVVVSLRGQTVRATANAIGAWRVQLAAMPAGGPFILTVRAGRDSLILRDVVIGDVWLASGQSNMEWRLRDANDGAQEAASAHDPQLREFKVPTSWSWTAEDELAAGSWSSADAAHAGDFSAVGYFFAREVRKATGVPIGIVNSSWGGSAIAPWLSQQALALESTDWVAIRSTEERYQSTMRDALRAKVGAVLPTVDSGLVSGRAVWADPAFNDSTWGTLVVPGAWERSGYGGMDGVAWYRTSFTLSAADLQHVVRVAVGAVDDQDITYVNGTEVGRTDSYAAARLYTVPATALRPGRNVLAVRVTDGGGDGGIMGNADQVYLQVGEERRAFAREWRFKVATVSIGEDGQHLNKIPGVLYNRMVHPLLPFPIKGVIWYQGESNANTEAQSRAYRQEFTTLIQSWRREWGGGRGDFPFLWVQLPNYGALDATPPVHSAWATMRESQSAALSLPKTGQAITIDIGDPTNIHPRNKRDVGHRLAVLAQSIAYRLPVVASGPTYRSHLVSGDRIDVRFDHATGGLESRGDNGRVGGFAIAGADGKFVWADARIVGGVVQVSNAAVPAPKVVRYAWGDSPVGAQLFNREGLPAAPFRTDKP